MNTRYLFMIAASAAIILTTSCSNEQEEPPLANVEIQLRADVDNIMMATRAATDIQGSQFAYTEGSPELINVEIQDAGTDNTYARGSYIFKTTNTTGSLTPNGTTPYFPNTGHNVNIYAYYPSSFGTTTASSTYTWSEGATTFIVATDQSGAAGYKASDLMYGVPASNPVARTASTIPLTFTHKLAKVIVRIKGDGNGVQTSDLVGATVTMKAMTSAPVSTACVATSQTWTSDDAADVNMGTVGVNADDDAIYETAAIVVPQTIAANSADVFTITLTNGSVYQYTPAKALTIAATTAYQFVFTLSRTAVSVSATIAPWGEGTGDTMNMIF